MRVDVTKMAYEDVQGVLKGVSQEVCGFFREGERVFVEIAAT